MKLHQQVEHYILDRIKNGELKPGDQIPTENEFAELLNASRPTVRQALNRLVVQGYIVRKKGIGSFVTETKLIHESTSYISSYRKEAQKYNYEILTKVLCLEVKKADEYIVDKLNIKKGKNVTMLTRLRTIPQYNQGHPVVLTTVYVPYERFPDMEQIDFSNRSFYDILNENDLEVKHAERELEVILPDKETADLLEINKFEPVIFTSSVGKTENDMIIEYSESFYPASSSKFMINIQH